MDPTNQTPVQPPVASAPATAPPTPPPVETPSSGKGLLLLGGIVLLVVTGAMLYYVLAPKPTQIATPATQYSTTPQPTIQPSEEQEIENIDTADPSLDLEDIEKDLADL